MRHSRRKSGLTHLRDRPLISFRGEYDPDQTYQIVASSLRPKTRCAREKPEIGNSPRSTQPVVDAPAKVLEATTVRPSLPAIFSSRAARLTAGPMQVKSSRLKPPIFPNRISPICSATPKRKGWTAHRKSG